MRLLFVCLLFVSGSVYSQEQLPVSNESMKSMMQKAQEIQLCMSKVDQNELKAIESNSIAFHKEVQSLCENGKRDMAQKKAIVFAREVTQSV